MYIYLAKMLNYVLVRACQVNEGQSILYPQLWSVVTDVPDLQFP